MKNEEKFLKNMSYQKSQNKLRSIPDIDIRKLSPDKPLAVTVAFLVVIGLMIIFSASAQMCIDKGVSPLKFFFQQLLGVGMGCVGMHILSNYNYKNLKTKSLVVALGVIVLLLLVKLVGTTVNGAQRWLYIGPFNLQPSELAKPAVVMLMAGAFYRDAKLFTQRKVFLAYIPILIMVAFIFKQPNLSMVLLLFITSVVMYIMAGGMWQILVGFLVPAVPIFLMHGLHDYQSSRILTWLHPEADPLGAGYNIMQSLVAIASGNFWGVGFGNSKQKLAWLPEAHTDFIFSVYSEEMGFIGCLLLICLFWSFLQRGVIIASKCSDMYGKLLALGLTFSICFQGFLNMWVASSFVPATGVPMPFISYGGTSIMVSLWMVGILFNISKENEKKIRMQQNVRYM